MSEEVEEFDEFDGKIPVMDKRRFNDQGEVKDEPRAAAKAAEPQRSPTEVSLEAQLKDETTRREAAEAKLVGVQAKFNEIEQTRERETAEMRERLKKSLENQAKQGQFNFLTTLLPVLDNLNRAVEASETDPDITHLRGGVIGTVRSFEKALIDVGVEPVAAVGQVFDPELHEAVDTVPADAESDGKVTAEYTRGYRFGEKLLRPARVQVGKAMADSVAD